MAAAIPTARRLTLKGRRTLMTSPKALRHALPSGDLINAILQYADVSLDQGGGRVLLRLSPRRREDPVIAAPLGREAHRLADVAVLWDEEEGQIVRVLDAAAGDHLEPVPAWTPPPPPAVEEGAEPQFELTPAALAYLAASGGRC
jgi:hypothetical protein